MKPIPAAAAPPKRLGQPTGRRSPNRLRVASQEYGEDADRLPDHVAEEDPERDRRGDGAAENLAADVRAGVGQREERDDQVARPRVQPVLEPLVRRDRRRDPTLGLACQLGGRLLAELSRERGRLLEVRPRRRIGAERKTECEPQNGRVDPRLVQRDPGPEAQSDRYRSVVYAGRSQNQQTGKEHDRDRERGERDVLRVRGRDHDERDQVVEDAEREDEGAETGIAWRDQGEDPEGECRVRGHRGAPTTRARMAEIEREEDQDREQHPAARGDQR